MIDGGENGVSSFRMGSRDPLYPACPVWIATTFPSRRTRAAEPVSGGEKGKGNFPKPDPRIWLPGNGTLGAALGPGGRRLRRGRARCDTSLTFSSFPFLVHFFPTGRIKIDAENGPPQPTDWSSTKRHFREIKYRK